MFMRKKRKVAAVLVGWTALHGFLWSFGRGLNGFWPFAPNYGISAYDLSEFFLYGLGPWIGYGSYLLWTSEKDDRS